MRQRPRTGHAHGVFALALLLTLGAGLRSAPALAAVYYTVDLGTTPPDLTKGVDPNIAVTFDDSGSMSRDYMGDNRPFDNAGWGSAPWRCAGVIDPRVTAAGDLRAHAMNGVYYNPNVQYLPPLYADGTVFPNADASLVAVWRDGILRNRPLAAADPGTTDFTRAWQCANGLANPVGTGPFYWRLKAGVDIGTPVAVNTAALYTVANWEAIAVPASEYQNWANWWAYYRTRNLMTRTALSRVFGGLGDNIRVVFQNINSNTATYPWLAKNVTTLGAFSGAVRSGFFNWVYQVPASGSTPDRAATIRAGEFFTGGAGSVQFTSADPYWNGLSGADKADLTCRQNFHMLVTDGYWNETDPNLPSGYFNGEASRMLPDATAYNAGAATSRIFSEVGGAPYDSSLANIAFYYWASDLRADLANNVPAYFPDKTTGVTDAPVTGVISNPAAIPEIYYNPANDPASWQHVVQFMVTLGVAGTLNYPLDFTALRTGARTWPRPLNNAASAVDDTWHASVNGRGDYFSASDPGELVSKLQDIINSIIARRSSSTASSLSTAVLTVNTVSYSTGYDSSDWSGTATARMVDADTGLFGSTLWDAGCKLSGGFCVATGTNPGAGRDPDTRVTLTAQGTGAGQGIAFRWAALPTALQSLLNQDENGVSDGHGSARLDFLRGDRGSEGVLFHRRGSVLGAVVNSQALYVAAPDSGYRDTFPAGTPEQVAAAAGTTYEQFVFDHRSRAPTIYLGANDGMLHAIDATATAAGGGERWAYVPYTLYPTLSKISATNYTLQPMVDATPIERDVFFGGAWHTILVGGLRLGGRGIYALDITSPTASEASPGAKVLWEFNHASSGGADLAYTYAQPNVARLANGKWVVLVPVGYFPHGSTAPAASNSYSSLFVLDAQTGTLIRQIKTSSAPQTAVLSYGLAAPVLGDYQNDQIDDVAFAGDIQGNLWRFDLSAANPANWSVDLIFKPLTPGARPITVMPRLFADVFTRKFDVVFGTGKYLGLSDRTNAGVPAQAIYGVREYGAAAPAYPITDSQLVLQDLGTLANGARVLTDLPVTAGHRGWYFLLDSAPGECSVVSPVALFNTNRAVLATLIPGGSDPCNPSRQGAVMVINAANGGASAGLASLALGFDVPSGYAVAGISVGNPPAAGTLPVATRVGGGNLMLPGILLPGGSTFQFSDSYWRRRSWRVLQQGQ
jgi:type IV pilus assembly protein PilY1